MAKFTPVGILILELEEELKWLDYFESLIENNATLYEYVFSEYRLITDLGHCWSQYIKAGSKVIPTVSINSISLLIWFAT